MRVWIFVFCVFQGTLVFCQAPSSYDAPIDTVLYSSQLKDSVAIQIIAPSVLHYSKDITYPVIFLLDKQNDINYQYNLQTIDYLTTLNAMPASIIVGITFDNRTRNKWTTPNVSGGKADDLVNFMFGDIYGLLNSQFPVANFTTLIGHSRTAIFSSYAFSKYHPIIHAVVASSTANFDFGDKYTQVLFEDLLKTVEKTPTQYFLTYSSGTDFQLDYHETSVDSFTNYLGKASVPANLTIQHIKEPVDHFVIPGLTVGRALSNIYESYRTAAILSLNLIQTQQQNDSVPWSQYLSFYNEQSLHYGFTISPDLLFYNSIASSYAADYNGVFKEKSATLALDVLLKCAAYYPFEYGTHLWISEIYLELKNYPLAIEYAEKSKALLKADSLIGVDDKMLIAEEIEAFIEEIIEEKQR
jgi:hypothetical protein